MSYFPHVKANLRSARCLNLAAIRAALRQSGARRTNPPAPGRLPKIDLLGSSIKVAHSIREGWENAVMYLAPHSRAEGANMCVMAGECKKGCLTSAGNLGMSGAEVSKIFKTRTYQADQNLFLNLLIADIARFLGSIPGKERGYKSKGDLPTGGVLRPTVRLNGTSDEPWEVIPLVIMPELLETLDALRAPLLGPQALRGERGPYMDQRIAPGKTYRNIFEVFPGLQFYDYTKYRIRARVNEYRAAFGRVAWPPNYYLAFSLSEQPRSEEWAWEALQDGHSVAAVFNTKVADVEAWRKIVEKVKPDGEADARRMATLRQQGRPLPWQVIPASVVINGHRIAVQNADVTDLRFKDGTKGGFGKLAWLSAKGDALRDCTGFVRDYATVNEPRFLAKQRRRGRYGIDVVCPRTFDARGKAALYQFGCPITSPEPWERIGLFGGCRQHWSDDDRPLSGYPTTASPEGGLVMKFPYRTWEEALVTGRPARTQSPHDKAPTAQDRRKRLPPYPTKVVLPRFDWRRVLAFVERDACVYGGSLEGLVISVLSGAPNLYAGPLAPVEKNKWAIAQSLVEEAAFAIAQGAAQAGAVLHLVPDTRGGLVYHDIFISRAGHPACPPATGWRRSLEKTSKGQRARSMIKRRNPRRREVRR